MDSQDTAIRLSRILYENEAYLFLGASFTTVGLLAAAFSWLRRRWDPLLLWFALFAVLYGLRLWIDNGTLIALSPTAVFLRNLRVAINYAVPIPAFFFFEAAGFLGRWGKRTVYGLTILFAGLIVATFLFGPLGVLQKMNDVTIVIAILIVILRSLLRREVTRDYVVVRRGLNIFGLSALWGNITGELGHYSRIRVEPFGFAAFLACLGYVAARQALERDATLGEIQKELEVAKRIQLSILPETFPASTNFKVAARYIPMTSVAGDFYEFLLGDDQQAGLLIADVSGHGVPAALIASMVKVAATSQRANAANPARLLSEMNATLYGNTQQQYVTAAYVHLDSKAGELRYSAAGHPPMLLLRYSGEVIEVEENGLLLAVFSSSAYTNAVRALEPGDRLLMYTDGITEASNAEREEFGMDRLRELLRKGASLAPLEAADLIVSAVRGWAQVQEDDLTVLICDYTADRKLSEAGQVQPAREEVMA